MASNDTFQLLIHGGRLDLSLAMDAVLSHFDQYSNSLSFIMEGLFTHYFHPDRPNYALEDMQWFLEFANKQNWNYCKPSETIQSEVNIVVVYLQYA